MRPEAHLAVIMISDADDMSSVTPSKLNEVLARVKGNDKSMYSAFAVLSLSKKCAKDPGNKGENANKNVLEFLEKTDGHAYDLCDARYGDKLAEAGRLIEKSAARDLEIHLESIPAAGTLRVTIAGTNEPVKYSYDTHTATITIESSEMDDQPEDAQIQVNYIKVDSTKLGTPSTKPVINASF